MALTKVNASLVEASGTPSSSTFLRGDGVWASAGAISDVFYENTQTVSADYTIPVGRNAMSAGPITIASGVTVTVSSGSTWVIV